MLPGRIFVKLLRWRMSIRAAAEEKAAPFGAAVFADAVAMLDAVRPDAVSICTPPKLHLPLAEAVAARGIACLCEKPPARTVAETEAIVAAFARQQYAAPVCLLSPFSSPRAAGAGTDRLRPTGRVSSKSTIALPFVSAAPATPGSQMPKWQAVAC